MTLLPVVVEVSMLTPMAARPQHSGDCHVVRTDPEIRNNAIERFLGYHQDEIIQVAKENSKAICAACSLS